MHIAATLTGTLLSQCCQCHHCHTSAHSNFTVLSLSSLLHRCQFTSLPYYCCCLCCNGAVEATAVTAQLSTPLSQYCRYHRCYTSGNCHRCDISVDSSVNLNRCATAMGFLLCRNNLLLAECEVRTASYGPSFSLPFKAEARGP